MCEHLLKSAEGSKEMMNKFENFFKAITTNEDVVDEKKTETDEVVETLKKVGVAVGVAAGVALFGWGISKLVNGSDKKILMKAPGKDNCFIERAVFESDPKRYFRSLRE